MRLAARSSLWLFLGLAPLMACSCDEAGGLAGRAPALHLVAQLDARGTTELVPGAGLFDFGPSRVGQEAVAVIELRNKGASALELEGLPSLESGSGAFELREVLAIACGGGERSDPQAPIAPGSCAALKLVFQPTAAQSFEDALVIRSNDPERGFLRVPIAGIGTTPDVVVCAGTTCSTAERGEITLDFGSVELGTSVDRTLLISNGGDLAAELSPYRLEGSSEFTVAPTPTAVTLAPGDRHELRATFRPLAGGPRTSTLVIQSDDPDQGSLTVHLVGTGDAGALCAIAPLKFGDIEVNTATTEKITLENCGTRPLELQELTLLSNGEFVLASPPSLPLPLEPAATFEVEVTFTPPSLDAFAARLKIVSDDRGGATVFVPISGTGTPPHVCDLTSQVSALDFGQVVIGTSKRADVVFRNDGYSPCVIPAGGIQIPNGAGVTFRVVELPPLPIEVGPIGSNNALLRVGIEWAPADAKGPDQAMLQVTPEGNAPVEVALSGSPTATGTCQFEVLYPAANGSFGRILNFGAVGIGRSKDQEVILANRGAAACTINGLGLESLLPIPIGGSGNDFRISSMPGALPLTVQAGDQIAIGIKFNPSGEVSYSAALPVYGLRVRTNDLRQQECSSPLGGGASPPGCVQIGLAGNGVTAILEVVPGRLDFGEVTIGCSSRAKSVSVYNLAADGMSVTGIAVDPPNAPFVITSAPALPLSPFNSGQQLTISLKYRPPDPRSHTAQILLTTSDGFGTTEVYSIPIEGEGTYDSTKLDTFHVPSGPKTDILWVIDNSGSMSEEQKALGQNASNFVSRAKAVNADFRMAVVTTDMTDQTQSGRFQGSPKLIESTQSNAASLLGTRMAGISTGGSGDERGLSAAHAALSEPLAAQSGPNGGFLRPDAKLAVIIVSDEEDGSNGTIDFYEGFFRSLKGARNNKLFSFHAIVGDNPSGCTSSMGDASAGKRYLELTKRTSGIFRSICSSDWGSIADDLGLNVFTPIVEFPLSREADDASLLVRVNGAVKVHGVDYTFDPVANAVVFNTGKEPPPSATVTVDYSTFCGP